MNRATTKECVVAEFTYFVFQEVTLHFCKVLTVAREIGLYLYPFIGIWRIVSEAAGRKYLLF